MVEPVGIVGMAAGAVEAVGADATFGQAYAFNEMLSLAELESCKIL